MKDAGAVVLQCKHSQIETGNLASIKMDIFDSEITMENVNGQIDIKEKHSHVTAKSVGSGNWEMFDCKVNVDRAKSLNISAKHGTYRIDQVDQLDLDVFDTRIEIKSVNGIRSDQTKHSKLFIDQLGESLKLSNSFDSRVEVSSVSSAFQGMDYEGKHGKIQLPLSGGIKYQLDVEMKHGKVHYNEEDFEVSRHVEKGANLVLQARRKGAGSNAPVVKVRGESTDIRLQ